MWTMRGRVNQKVYVQNEHSMRNLQQVHWLLSARTCPCNRAATLTFFLYYHLKSKKCFIIKFSRLSILAVKKYNELYTVHANLYICCHWKALWRKNYARVLHLQPAFQVRKSNPVIFVEVCTLVLPEVEREVNRNRRYKMQTFVRKKERFRCKTKHKYFVANNMQGAALYWQRV